jgi:chromosome segregation ATPase
VTSQEVEEIKGHFDKVAQGLREEIGGLRAEMGAEFASVRGEMATEFANVRDEMTAEFANVRGEMGGLRAEMTAGFAKVRDELSDFRKHSAETGDYLMQQIAEAGQSADSQAAEIRSRLDTVETSLSATNQRLADLTHEVRSGFAGVNAELRLLHATDDALLHRLAAQERRGV